MQPGCKQTVFAKVTKKIGNADTLLRSHGIEVTFKISHFSLNYFLKPKFLSVYFAKYVIMISSYVIRTANFSVLEVSWCFHGDKKETNGI